MTLKEAKQMLTTYKKDLPTGMSKTDIRCHLNGYADSLMRQLDSRWEGKKHFRECDALDNHCSKLHPK